jgi:hypothetical protein
MKEQILEISEKLRLELITEDEAQNLLLCLFGVIKSVCECKDYEWCNGPYKLCRDCGKVTRP